MVIGPIFVLLGLVQFLWQLFQNQKQSAQYTQRSGVPPPPPGGPRSLRVASNGQDLGEVPIPTIKKMIATGQLSMQDYYFDAETNAWMPLDGLAGLVDVV